MWCCGTKSEAIVIVKCWYRLIHKQQKIVSIACAKAAAGKKNHTQKTIKAKRNACRCAFMRFGVCLFECLCVCVDQEMWAGRPKNKFVIEWFYHHTHLMVPEMMCAHNTTVSHRLHKITILIMYRWGQTLRAKAEEEGNSNLRRNSSIYRIRNISVAEPSRRANVLANG